MNCLNDGLNPGVAKLFPVRPSEIRTYPAEKFRNIAATKTLNYTNFVFYTEPSNASRIAA